MCHWARERTLTFSLNVTGTRCLLHILQKFCSSNFFYFLGFSQDLKEFTRSALEDIIDVVYKTTSKRLLEVLFDRYKFLEHLQVNCSIFVNNITCLLRDYFLRGVG